MFLSKSVGEPITQIA